jgi:hypothetical protein
VIQNGVQFNGDSFPSDKISIVNKTGGALVKGGIYALDLTKTVATDTRGQLSYVVAVAAGNIGGILVVAEKALADGESGLGVVYGPTKVLVKADVTNIAAGDRLKAVAASTKAQKASAAAGSLDIGVAKALEPATTDGALITVFFCGLNLNVALNGATT